MTTPPLPLMTITVTSEEIGRQLAQQLAKALAGFRISVDHDYGELCLVCERTREPEFIPVQGRELMELVRLALEHDCEPPDA